MPHCDPCDRWFNTMNSYNQHINNSVAHMVSYGWECDICTDRFASERSRDLHHSDFHPYCAACNRVFRNENNLMQHMHSRTHQGTNMECPFCKRSFPTASATTIHLESGTCTSGLTRTRINELVRRLDHQNVITRPMLTMEGYDSVETVATARAWDGVAYRCYFCPRGFTTLAGLNQHIKSPVHEQAMYRCPKMGCAREYKLLSGLVQHVESESCGLMRFSQVQHEAKSGIQNMVGRMIMR